MGSCMFLNTNLSRPISIIRPYLYNYNPIKSYGKSKGEEHEDGGQKERAPSLAQEFKRVEQEKAKSDDHQGVASQTVENAYPRADDAVTGDGDLDSVKKRMKEPQPGADYRTN